MNFISLDITIAAALTSLALCIYTYAKDRVEKEPVGLLALLFGAGGLLSIPAVYCGTLTDNLFGKLFGKHYSISPEGLHEFSSDGIRLAFFACVSFVSVALIEMAAKWLVMFLLTHKSKHFNSLFDGIVYGVFVSLGFAMIDNIRFAWMNGWDMLLLRSLSTVPVHMFVGVFMGYYYTIWHSLTLASKAEKDLAEQGRIKVIKPYKPALSLVLSFVIPYFIQALYTFAEYSYVIYSKLALYLLLAVLFILAFLKIHKTSYDDALDNKVVSGMLLKKYPDYKTSEEDLK